MRVSHPDCDMVKSLNLPDLLSESQQLERAGDVGGALSVARQALKMAQTAGDQETVAASLVRVAYVQFRLGRYEEARRIAQDASEIAAPSSFTEADALLILGNCAAETVSLADAEAYYHQAADLSREIGYPLVRMRAFHCLGQAIFMPRGQFDLALASDQEAYRIAKDENLRDWLHFPLVTIAWINQITGHRHRAQKALNELGVLTKNSPGSLHRGYRDFLLGNLAQDEGDTRTARDLYMQARSVAEAVGEPGLNVEVRVAMSRNEQLKGNSAKALDWADDAVAYARRVGYRHEEGKALAERGRAAWLNGNPDDALADLRAAIRTLEPLKAAFDLSYASLILSALLAELNAPEAATVWLATSKQIAAADQAFLLERERAIAFPLVARHLNDDNQELASVCESLLSHLERVPPPPLSIHTLGSFSVTQGHQQISENVWRQRRAGELFRLLLISPGRSLLRDQIVEALWPEKAPGTTRALLHQATSALRRALEPDLPGKFPSRYIVFNEGRVTLRLPPGSQVDFDLFEEHARRREWETAVACYQGELYPDDRYAAWAAEYGERLSQLAVRALVNAAIHRQAAGNAEAALEACQKALTLEPWHELATITAMKACMALDNRAGALRLYQELDRRLQEELDTEPEPPVQEYYRSIL